MGRQTVEECDEGMKRFTALRLDYKKRLAETGSDQFLRERVGEWVVDACERVQRETRDHAQALLENALRNKNANAKIIKSTLYETTMIGK